MKIGDTIYLNESPMVIEKIDIVGFSVNCGEGNQIDTIRINDVIELQLSLDGFGSYSFCFEGKPVVKKRRTA